MSDSPSTSITDSPAESSTGNVEEILSTNTVSDTSVEDNLANMKLEESGFSMQQDAVLSNSSTPSTTASTLASSSSPSSTSPIPFTSSSPQTETTSSISQALNDGDLKEEPTSPVTTTILTANEVSTPQPSSPSIPFDTQLSTNTLPTNDNSAHLQTHDSLSASISTSQSSPIDHGAQAVRDQLSPVTISSTVTAIHSVSQSVTSPNNQLTEASQPTIQQSVVQITGLRGIPTGSKVLVNFRAIGSAPIMKRTKFTLNAAYRFERILEWLSKTIHLKPTETLFVYCNNSFAPSPDAVMYDLFQCFEANGELVLNYALQDAWG